MNYASKYGYILRNKIYVGHTSHTQSLSKTVFHVVSVKGRRNNDFEVGTGPELTNLSKPTCGVVRKPEQAAKRQAAATDC